MRTHRNETVMSRLRRMSAAFALVALVAAMVLPTPLSAIPYGTKDLTSPTHPSPTTWYTDDSPEFEWDSDGPVPEVIGNGNTDGRAYGVDFAGDHAYIADGNEGLTVVDISELGTPTALASADTSGSAWSVDVCGDYAVVASLDAGVHVVDVSEPGTPTVAGWTDTPQPAFGLVVEDSYAYVAADSEVLVVDVSDPTSPTIAGSVATAGTAHDVDVLGDTLVVAQHHGNLRTYDISDPTSPTLTGDSGVAASSVVVDGAHAFTVRGTSVDVVDLSDPTSPTVIGSVDADTGGLGSFSVNDIAVSGDYVYIACVGGGPITDRDFQLIDVGDPTNPVLVDTVDVSSNTYQVAAFDGHALLANDHDGLAVVELWELGVPERIGTFDTDGVAYAVDVQGDLAYFADWGERLTIADISDPTAPALVGTLNQNWAVRDIEVRGGFAYAAAVGGGLSVFDVSDPTAPAWLASADTTGIATGVDVQGDLAYVADATEGLQVFDVSTPSSPAYMGGVATGQARKVDVCGPYAFLADDQALTVIDVSEPGTPTVLASEALTGTNTYAYAVTVVGDVAYVGGSKSVHAVDVSDPADPTHLDSITTAGTPYGLDVAGHLLFAAAQVGASDSDDPGALYVVDVSDPGDLQLLETVETRRHAWDVAVAGDVAYVCNNRYVGGSSSWPDSGLDVISWGGPVGYSYVLDASDATMPDDTVDVISPMASFTGVDPGEWWFTVKAISRSGDAGPTMQRKIRVTGATERLADNDRFTTAVEIAREGWGGASGSDWSGVEHVVLASGDDRAAADPLAAAGLCGVYDAPLFLVSSSFVPGAVKGAIDQIADDNPGSTIEVHIVGGPVSVPDARYNEIASYVGASRLAKDRLLSSGDRFDMAAEIAREVDRVGGTTPSTVLVANGADPDKFFDALALSPIAANNGYPILLVSEDAVPSATRSVMNEFSPTTVIVGGGPATVSEKVRSQLGATRWSDSDRYSTATTIADKAIGAGMLDATYVGVAAKLPDALTGGSMVGVKGGPLVITDGSSLTRVTGNWLSANEADIAKCYVFGGVKSVTPAVMSQIEAKLQ